MAAGGTSGRVLVDPELIEVIADPGDGLVERLVEGVAGCPAPELACQGSARQEAADLACGGADADRLGLDAQGPAQPHADPFDERADRQVIPAADVHDPPEGRVA